MKEQNTGDNLTLLDLPEVDFKDFPEVDFEIEPLDLAFDDFDIDLEGVDLDLHFDDIMSDTDFDLPGLDFLNIPGLEINEGGTK